MVPNSQTAKQTVCTRLRVRQLFFRGRFHSRGSHSSSAIAALVVVTALCEILLVVVAAADDDDKYVVQVMLKLHFFFSTLLQSLFFLLLLWLASAGLPGSCRLCRRFAGGRLGSVLFQKQVIPHMLWCTLNPKLQGS